MFLRGKKKTDPWTEWGRYPRKMANQLRFRLGQHLRLAQRFSRLASWKSVQGKQLTKNEKRSHVACLAWLDPDQTEADDSRHWAWGTWGRSGGGRSGCPRAIRLIFTPGLVVIGVLLGEIDGFPGRSLNHQVNQGNPSIFLAKQPKR